MGTSSAWRSDRSATPTAEAKRATRPDPPGGTLRLVHHHQGYARVRAGAFMGSTPSDEEAIAAARNAAETTPGFRRWSHNPATGSIVVEYAPGVVDVDDLLRRLARAAGLSGVEAEDASRMPRDRAQLVHAFLSRVVAINGLVRQATGDWADLRELVPVTLLGISVVSFVLHDERGRLPRWNSALYHSYRIFLQWHRREVRAHEAAARGEEGERRKPGDLQ
jgi:hypothetical protein